MSVRVSGHVRSGVRSGPVRSGQVRCVALYCVVLETDLRVQNTSLLYCVVSKCLVPYCTGVL